MDIFNLQRYLPASVKNMLKPYYRKVFPNQLCINFMITFRCNYRCSYCQWVTKFDYSKIYKKENEPTAKEWIKVFDKLPKANIYLSGGEPFLFKELPEFINGLKKHKIIGMVTNATAKTSVYKRINKKIHLNLSFHREFVNEEQFISKINELRQINRFHISINIVATRENIKFLPKLKKFFGYNNVSFHVDPFVDPNAEFKYTPEEKEILSHYLAADRNKHIDMLEFNSYVPKRCSAGQNYINIMPDGTVFRCVTGSDYFHSPLKRRILDGGPDAPYDSNFFLMGNIFDSKFKLDKNPAICNLPCTAACDRDMAKIKRVAK